MSLFTSGRSFARESHVCRTNLGTALYLSLPIMSAVDPEPNEPFPDFEDDEVNTRRLPGILSKSSSGYLIRGSRLNNPETVQTTADACPAPILGPSPVEDFLNSASRQRHSLPQPQDPASENACYIARTIDLPKRQLEEDPSASTTACFIQPQQAKTLGPYPDQPEAPSLRTSHTSLLDRDSIFDRVRDVLLPLRGTSAPPDIPLQRRRRRSASFSYVQSGANERAAIQTATTQRAGLCQTQTWAPELPEPRAFEPKTSTSSYRGQNHSRYSKMPANVPRPGPAKLKRNAGPDEWLEAAKNCKYLSEAHMKELCERVKELLMEGENLTKGKICNCE